MFGAIPGVADGTTFPDRRAAAASDVHKPLQVGISGGAIEGADSIVVSGGYEDDEDYGGVIVYTGHGGQDVRGRQVADQTLTAQNLALAVSCDHGLPIRVVRGAGGEPAFSPSSGYRYDGLFYIERYWQDTGRSGFKIWRYRLVAEPDENPVTNPPPSHRPAGVLRRSPASNGSSAAPPSQNGSRTCTRRPARSAARRSTRRPGPTPKARTCVPLEALITDPTLSRMCCACARTITCALIEGRSASTARGMWSSSQAAFCWGL